MQQQQPSGSSSSLSASASASASASSSSSAKKKRSSVASAWPPRPSSPSTELEKREARKFYPATRSTSRLRQEREVERGQMRKLAQKQADIPAEQLRATETRQQAQAAQMTAATVAADQVREQNARQRIVLYNSSDAINYLKRFVGSEPMTLRQHAARRLAAAIMQHDGDGWSTGNVAVSLTLPNNWFRREVRAAAAAATTEAATALAGRPTAQGELAAVHSVVMGNCSEEHRRDWVALWQAQSGVDQSLLEHGQEGSVGWWGGDMDAGTTVSAGQTCRGSLESDFKLLVACHLRGRHLVRFIKSQPGGIKGIMEADVGQGRLGVPSEHFFHLLRVIMAQASQYLGAVCHLEGAGCGCGCGITFAHREAALSLELELAAFESAVAGETGVVHHGLHWYGFTSIFNDAGFSETHPPSLAFRYYRLVRASKADADGEIEFILPYPLDPALVLTGASSGKMSSRFKLGGLVAQREIELTSEEEIRQLRDRAGWERSDEDHSFASMCGEEQLFTALSVLEKSAKRGRPQVCFFLAFWMLQHLRGVFHQPAGSPNYFFRKFQVDVYVHLAKAMAFFFLPFDVAISCLALAEGSTVFNGGGEWATNLFANPWQMTCARQAVLASYGLYDEAASLFLKNVGRIPIFSLFYDELVIDHLASQLNHTLDILFEMYVGRAMHKFCSRSCWDPESSSMDKYEQLLRELKRTIHGRLAESKLSKQLEVNLRATLNLLPLFELTGERLKKHGHHAATLAETLDDDARQTRAFIEANLALRPNAALRPDSRLLSSRLTITFAEIVPIDGSKITKRTEYGTFILNMLTDLGFWNTAEEAEWKEGRPLADRVYAGLLFFLLWQGPTKAEPFWPDWDPETGPAASVDFFQDQRDRSEIDRKRRKAVRQQFKIAKFVHTVYKVNTNNRHPRLPLLARFLEFFPAKRCISPYAVEHTPDTAACLVKTTARNFCLESGSTELFAGAEQHGSFLRHVLRRDGPMVEDVLDFGRRAVRWTRIF